MKKPIILNFLLILISLTTAKSQYYGEIWLKENPGIQADTVRGLIKINPRTESVVFIDSAGVDWVYDHRYIHGFIWSDQYFYNKPVYQYLPIHETKRAQDIRLYQIIERGQSLWLLEKNKELFLYHPRIDRINKIESEKDLFRNISNEHHDEIKISMQRELWHWSFDLPKIVKFYNQINYQKP